MGSAKVEFHVHIFMKVLTARITFKIESATARIASRDTVMIAGSTTVEKDVKGNPTVPICTGGEGILPWLKRMKMAQRQLRQQKSKSWNIQSHS